MILVAVFIPIRKSFFYYAEENITPGTRVLVPFGQRKLLGIVISNENRCHSNRKLKPIYEKIDKEALFSQPLFKLLLWGSSYYHYPIGKVFYAALPDKLKTSITAKDPTLQLHYKIQIGLTKKQILQDLKKSAPKQHQLISLLKEDVWLSSADILSVFPNFRPISKKLVKKCLILEKKMLSDSYSVKLKIDSRFHLSNEQCNAISTIENKLNQYSPCLLHGITGSGKTEVYIELVKKVINFNKQVLVMVPEIALTPQLIKNFIHKLGKRIYSLHSGMSSHQRYMTWYSAKNGIASVVIGTRSSIFVPFLHLGLIVVDEEHDGSYKQQDGFLYHARDLAVKRAKLENIPIILGSATPSMESTYNTSLKRYELIRMTERIGDSKLPKINIIDLKMHNTVDGLSHPLLKEIDRRLTHGEQTILYINRRGFSPIIQCNHCGWKAVCRRCDAYLNYHQTTNQFRCHHCNSCKKKQNCCPQCQGILSFIGSGTQRIAKAISKCFPNSVISRIDRDQFTDPNKLEAELKKISSRKVDIIIGTQLITKGHNFPQVTLVGILNSDQGMYSINFRSGEQLFQHLVQVAGRAGRSSKPGLVLIQTFHPNNKYFDFIKNQNFDQFSDSCLQERKFAQLPPYSYMALWRAETKKPGEAIHFLEYVQTLGKKNLLKTEYSQITIFDAVHAPVEKLFDQYRAQLLVKSTNKAALHQLLKIWIDQVDISSEAKRIKWEIDIDPMEMF